MRSAGNGRPTSPRCAQTSKRRKTNTMRRPQRGTPTTPRTTRWTRSRSRRVQLRRPRPRPSTRSTPGRTRWRSAPESRGRDRPRAAKAVARPVEMDAGLRGMPKASLLQWRSATVRDATSTIRLAEGCEWRLLAKCRGEDPSLFFHPEGERGARKSRQRKAKAICAECPVAAPCRWHSLRFPEHFGTRGRIRRGT
jgi:WhiB family transcriptional regulator, redox-sensing transcriptional regulator